MRAWVYGRVGNAEQLDGMAMDAKCSRVNSLAEKKRAWLYGRVALDDGIALAAQMYFLRRWATEKDYVIVGETAEAGRGIQPNLPGISAVMQAAGQNQMDVLIIRSIERLTRRYMDIPQYIDALKKNGVDLVSIDDNKVFHAL